MTRAGKIVTGAIAAAGTAAAIAFTYVPPEGSYTVPVVAAVPKAAIEAAGFEYQAVPNKPDYGMLTGVWYTVFNYTPKETKTSSGVTSSVIAMYANHCTGVPGEIRIHNDAQLTNVTAVIHR